MDQALRNILAVSLFIVSSKSEGQVWCPPGAVWNYNIQSFMVEGCETRTYAGDTLLDGRSAQHIHVDKIVMNYLSMTLDTLETDFYTSQQDGVVLAWNTLGGNTGWDTLYWFSAVPGDRWYPPGADDFCTGQEPWGMLEVGDTGSVIASGLPLRYLDVSYVDEF
ncbi:MAG: hypothetical protein JNM91_12465, partial [Flavobacteriales bacterium]|nr:hypothetical protein [Flavobacteriales bacterium]